MNKWIEEGRVLARGCWGEGKDAAKDADPALVEAVASQIAGWIELSASWCRDIQFYQDLIDKCAEHIGIEAYTADDGSIGDSPIRLKIPELVRDLVEQNESLMSYKNETRFEIRS